MVHQKKTEILITLIRRYLGTTPRRILVVGCGSGLEALALAEAFKTEVIGIDVASSFAPRAAGKVELRIGDATRLDFSNGYFDLIYSFHVLEHIPQYPKALAEMARVSTDGGGFLIGTPNRARWIGYLGSQTATWPQKIAWNWVDWKGRLRGKFRNENGAHAGFFPHELTLELERVFSEVQEITLPYYLDLYSPKRVWIQLLGRSGLGKFFFPAIYFIGRR
jgi:ubiquinone/menaquinone biosynthesis C-methylase UbiE